MPYPAPYEEPWGRLAGDLRAVAASTGLKVRELWRRNGEGDLSVPGFWPPAWTSLFWPLLLSLVLASLVALGLGLARGLGGLPSASSPPSLSASELSPPAPRAEQRSSLPSVPEPKAGWEREGGGERQTAGPPAAVPAPPPTLELDPLLGLLIQDDSGSLISTARPVPAEGRLDLELSDLFQALPDLRRQQQADGWLQRSLELGYEHLRLLDRQGVVVGQAARVGGGMVLLDPPGPVEP